ncbi:MAG: metallophosphoesterase family protein [Steroidobacteraceae bacterium]
MIIAQISDTHISLRADDGECRAADLERTLADINALDPAPDVIIHTGDVVHGGRREDYAAAASLLAKARAPLYVAPGNRDDRDNLRHSLSRWVPAADSPLLDYAVEDFPVRLVAVDSLSGVSNKGDFSPERARRLLALIEAQPRKPTAVFMHHPPFTVQVGPDPLNFVTAEAMATLQRALERSACVVAVFCGHVHRSTCGRIGSIPVMVAPCTATTLRKGDFPPQMRTRPIYHLHRLNAACELVTELRIVGDEQGSSG